MCLWSAVGVCTILITLIKCYVWAEDDLHWFSKFEDFGKYGDRDCYSFVLSLFKSQEFVDYNTTNVCRFVQIQNTTFIYNRFRHLLLCHFNSMCISGQGHLMCVILWKWSLASQKLGHWGKRSILKLKKKAKLMSTLALCCESLLTWYWSFCLIKFIPTSHTLVTIWIYILKRETEKLNLV